MEARLEKNIGKTHWSKAVSVEARNEYRVVSYAAQWLNGLVYCLYCLCHFDTILYLLHWDDVSLCLSILYLIWFSMWRNEAAVDLEERKGCGNPFLTNVCVPLTLWLNVPFLAGASMKSVQKLNLISRIVVPTIASWMFIDELDVFYWFFFFDQVLLRCSVNDVSLIMSLFYNMVSFSFESVLTAIDQLNNIVIFLMWMK